MTFEDTVSAALSPAAQRRPDAPDDVSLLQGVARRDPRSLAELQKRHHARLWSYTVLIGGEDVTREPGKTRVRRVLGYLPQDLGFYPDLTAFQFLDYIGTLKMDDASVRRRRINEVPAWTRKSGYASATSWPTWPAIAWCCSAPTS